jgi:dihydropteroate synthase
LTQDSRLASRDQPARWLVLGDKRFDITTRALVIGILNRTKDSFYDQGAYFDFDAFLSRAEELVAQGADILEVGGVKAGVGPEVSLDEELRRVVPAVQALAKRFDVPVAVDTWNSTVAEASFVAGASLGNDISGFADPAYLKAASAAGASVVATHIRLAPRVYDPNPYYRDVVAEVEAFLLERAQWAMRAGLAKEQIVIDPGLDLGKNTSQSLELLASYDRFARLGFPLFLASSRKDFVGEVLGGLPPERRLIGSLGAAARGIALGARLVRVHDVAETCKVRDAVQAVLESQ